MRKKIVIFIIGLLCCVAMMGQNSSFYSTSAYMTTRQTPVVSYQSPKTIGSLSAISAANYASLNSDGGACCHAPAGPHKAKRPGDLAIGEADFRSPVGELPIGLIIVFILAYAGYKKKKKASVGRFFCDNACVFHIFIVILQAKLK